MSNMDRVVQALVQRAGGEDVIPSRQPQALDANRLYSSLVRWVDTMNLTEPAYMQDTRARDQWLDAIWRREPFMAGVIPQVVSLKKNQGYTLTGGRNPVNKYDQVLHNANGGKGWRNYVSKESYNYFCSDLGTATEIARQGTYPYIDQARLAELVMLSDKSQEARDRLLRMNDYIANMPFGGLYHIDSTHCFVTGNPYAPLQIEYDIGGVNRWLASEFFLFNSLPNGRYDMQDVGFCALSRAISMVQIMIAVIRHDKEQLSAAAPPGFLALKGYTPEQWKNALKARDEDRDNRGVLYMRDLMVLASKDQDVDAKLISLSNLPQGWKIEEWMKVYAQVVAGDFGFDLREFYTITGGSLGVNGEAIVQADKTTGKGEADFTVEHAENIQRLLPDTVEFQYDNRNDAGDQALYAAQKEYTDLLLNIYTQTKDAEFPVLTTEQLQRAFIMQGIINPDLLDPTKDDQGVATDMEKQRARGAVTIRRAAEAYPDEQIIRVHSDGRETVLWNSGYEMLRPKVWRGATIARENVYKTGDIVITEQDIADVTSKSRAVSPKLALLLSAGVANE